MRRRISVLFLAAGIVVGVTSSTGQNPDRTGTFETAWQIVNDTYFDPTFGGLRWQDVRDRYRPRIAAAKSDKEFYELINAMLWELKVSHANLVPPGSFALYEPVVFAEGSPGIDVRLINEMAVITSVRPGSPAEKAGFAPGNVIQAIDGVPVEQIVRDAGLRTPPPSNSRARIARITKAILSRVYGTPGNEVSITYLDKGEKRREQNVSRTRRSGVAVGQGGAFFLAIEFEARRLDSRVGYIRLNTLQPQLAAPLVGAIKSMGNVRGIILDLRGNSGGEIEGMPELFLKERAVLYLRRTRNGETRVSADPAADSFSGPLAVLIDATSQSASELLAACLQSIGRAVVVGERSPGAVMEADMVPFPNGAILMHPVAQLSTPDGTVLEGRGVVPDIEVGLSRQMLLRGIDPQLAAAVRYLERQ